MSRPNSRIAAARGRAEKAKQVLIVGSAISFLAAGVLATRGRAAASTSATNPSVVRAQDDNEAGDEQFDFGSGFVGPSFSQPQVQTSGS